MLLDRQNNNKTVPKRINQKYFIKLKIQPNKILKNIFAITPNGNRI